MIPSVRLLVVAAIGALAACGSPAQSVRAPSEEARETVALSPTAPTSASPSANPTALAPVDPVADSPIGGVGVVIATEPLVVRSAPGTGDESTILGRSLYPGMRFVFTDGPVDASGYAWYEVRAGNAHGWAAAASRDGEPWLGRVRNGRLAFAVPFGTASEGEAPHPQIITVNPDGSGERQLTQLTQPSVSSDASSTIVLAFTCGYGIYDVTWAPDGSTLAYGVGCGSEALHLIDADTGEDRVVARGRQSSWAPTSDRLASAPVWSLCANAMCAEPDLTQAYDIQVTQLASGETTDLTSHVGGVATRFPSWSPDGSRLAYVRWAYGLFSDGPPEVWIVGADGTDQGLVAAGDLPAWSPNGQHLVLQRSLPDAGFAQDVIVTALDGTETAIGVGAHAGWTPDGSAIVLRPPSDTPHAAGTLLVSPAGETIGEVAIDGGFISWSPDGRRVLFARDNGSGTFTVMHSLADGSDVQLVGEYEVGVGEWAWQPLIEPLVEG